LHVEAVLSRHRSLQAALAADLLSSHWVVARLSPQTRGSVCARLRNIAASLLLALMTDRALLIEGWDERAYAYADGSGGAFSLGDAFRPLGGEYSLEAALRGREGTLQELEVQSLAANDTLPAALLCTPQGRLAVDGVRVVGDGAHLFRALYVFQRPPGCVAPDTLEAGYQHVFARPPPGPAEPGRYYPETASEFAWLAEMYLGSAEDGTGLLRGAGSAKTQDTLSGCLPLFK
jgi:hypothetical protein